MPFVGPSADAVRAPADVTTEGIRRDLEWMKRVGLGGFLNFDASLFGYTVVGKRVAYMTPEWKDAFRYAIEPGVPRIVPIEST